MIEIDIAVVGGGLAGLTAALEAARLGRKTVNFGGAAPGGLLLSIESVQGLPEHPDGIPGYDLGPMTQEAALEAGADCRGAEADAIEREGAHWIVRSADGAVRARAVILAPGSHIRPLGIPGEAEFAGKGVSHCASCDAPMLRGRAVAVVGGGDAACQEALTIAGFAAQVHLLVRGSALRARPQWQQRVAAEPKIAPRFGVAVEAIVGDAAVTGVRLAGGELLAVDAVFAYPGLMPNTGWLAGLVPLAADGRIVVDAGLRCAPPGLFAAGCARAGSSGQAAEAAADGARAARAAHESLN